MSRGADNLSSSSATQFAGNSRDIKTFEDNISKMKLSKRLADNIREMDYSVAGMPSRAMVTWIYENKVGSVSEPFDLKDKYVVLLVTGSLEEGVQPAAAARMTVEPILRNRKKAAELTKKFTNGSSLEATATANNLQVMSADSVMFANPFIPDLGNEPRVIGAAFNKSLVNKVSDPIEGMNGVFIVRVNRLGAMPSQNVDVMMQKKAQESQLKQYANFSTMEALRKSAKIEDSRMKAGY